jgi:hypothetical protein
MNADERFPKPPLLTIRWQGMPVKIGKHPRMWWLYSRMANGATLYFAFWQFTWRMPWLPQAAWSSGWDACWRQMYAERIERENRPFPGQEVIDAVIRAQCIERVIEDSGACVIVWKANSAEQIEAALCEVAQRRRATY